MSAPLSTELRAKYNVRSMPIRKDDETSPESELTRFPSQSTKDQFVPAMTNLAAKSDKKTRKRKAESTSEKQKANKKHHVANLIEPAQVVEEADTFTLQEVPEKLEQSQIWNNLDLILSLQNKNIHIQRKIELAYGFVETWVKNDVVDNGVVSVSRLLVFLSDWIQSVLIPKGKDDGMSMDIRCWRVFQFCLVEASSRRLSLNFSRNLLRLVAYALENALELLNKRSLSEGYVLVYGEEFKVPDIVLECITLVFSLHNGVLSDNLDMWLSAVCAVLQFAHRVFSDNTLSRKANNFAMKFSCLMLDYFSKYLKIHPCRKNGFHDFVDKLLEPVFNLSGLLHSQDGAEKLSMAVDEVLSQGLFHNIHVDGFLNFCSTEQYVASSDENPKEQKLNFKSYHRHLFGKLERIVGDKKVSVFGSVHKMFRLLIQRVKIQRGVSSTLKDTNLAKNNGKIKTDSSSDDAASGMMSTEIRKSLFDVFAQIMEPLLLELSNYADLEIEVGPTLLDIYGVIKCINSVVNVLMQEKVYSRTEDTSEGACFDYLKKVYDVIMLFSTKVSHLWLQEFKNDAWNHTIAHISEELILIVQQFVEIDYKVTGDDLVKLWSMTFSLFSLGSGIGKQDSLSLRARALFFGCQLLNLYCELRQVNSVIVSLCEAMRCLGVFKQDNVSSSVLNQLYARSVRDLIGSQAFRSALVNAVTSIPEGQSTGCIHQLAGDISDSVEWIKASCLAAASEDMKQLPSSVSTSETFYLHFEVFGAGLSEVYSLVLDSVSVTSGNSSLIGSSVEAVMAVMRPIISALVAQQPNLVNFLLCFAGAATNNENIASKSHLQKLRGSAHFIILFIFRLYLSCRSLYRQAISLVAPKISREFSELMGDPVSAYSGRELLEINDWTYEGYFSWMLQPSTSLVTVIKFLQHGLYDNVSASPALTYVLHAMAIHRLVDLNRQLKTLEYLQHNVYTDQSQMNVEDKMISGCKISSLESHVSVLRQEAVELVELLMGQLSLVTDEYTTLNKVQTVKGWNLVICSLNSESLQIAIWRILCQNIDVWSIHVSKKQLKLFLTVLIRTSIPHTFEHGCPETVTIQKISMELLRNTMLYEQKSIRRHLASRICLVLNKSMLALPNGSGNLNHDFSSSALLEVLVSLDNHWANVRSKKDESYEVPSEIKQKFQFLTCHGFLDLLCWMPLGFLKHKSFSGLASAVLGLERLAIANILETCSPPCEWLSLLVACRRALKHIVMATREDVEASSPFFLVTPDNSVAILWFLKTVCTMSRLYLTFQKDCDSKTREKIFTLLDHTSAIILNLCKNQVHHIHKVALLLEGSDKMDGDSDNDAWRNLVIMGETLRDEVDKLDLSVTEIEVFNDNISGIGLMNLCMNNLSCHLSCVHGFLWGLASSLSTKLTSIGVNEAKLEKEMASKVKSLPSMFSDFLTRSLHFLLYERSQWPGIVRHNEIEFSNGFSGSSDSQHETLNLTDFPHVRSYSESDAEVPSEELQWRHYNRPVLRSLLKDEYPEAAFLLRQLLLAASAGIRLKLFPNRVPASSSLIPLLTSVSQLVLLELVDPDESPSLFAFVWLDGVLKYLEELGNHFSVNRSTQIMNDSYNKLIDLLLRVDGKCISFLGKQATLESHETESITKLIDNQTLFHAAHHPYKPSVWNEFRYRLRTSIIGFISNASERHLLSAIQAIDRTLVGVHAGSTVIYEVVTGSANGGRVSQKVAAGVDFLDLVLEHASGRKRLGVVQRHIERLVAGLFNITWHLQSSHVFMEQSTSKQVNVGLDPDAGAVVLMCTEVLTRIFAKQALFHLQFGHVGQAFRLPGALFQSFLHINHDISASNKKEAPSVNECTPAAAALACVDRKFTIDLYAASCRLLSTVIKHHKDEHVLKSIALLQDSVSVLLYCLETVNSDLVTEGYFSWQVQEGVRLASLLRRVYEELRQQKDVYGKQIFLFLSHYIEVYSGCGPNKTGIRREIDEALKPGIYALIDACSPADLQYIHTVFGEGPCRSTLARLQQDYESNFRYVGKV